MRVLLKTAFIVAVAVTVLIGAQSACQKAGPGNEEPPPSFPLSIVKPMLEPAEGYPSEQVKDGVSMILSTESPVEHIVYRRTVKEKFTLFEVNGMVPFEVKDKPDHFELTPDHLILKLNLTNNLNHVLRLNGAVPVFKIDGKNVPIGEPAQQELLQTVLTPYTSDEMTIAGPKWSQLEGRSTVNFAIYDVITETDAAGNPTKRTTFEWIFAIRPETISKNIPTRSDERKMTRIQAQQYLSDPFVQ